MVRNGISYHSRQDRAALQQAWFYLPRILHPGSQVYAEKPLPGGNSIMEAVPLAVIERRAAAAATRQTA